MTRRVVVTGVGLVCALGIGTDESLEQSRRRARAASAPITHFDTTGFDCTIAGEVKNFDPFQWIEKKELKKMGRFIQIALAARGLRHEDGRPAKSLRTCRSRRSRRLRFLRHRRIRHHRARTLEAGAGRAGQDLSVLHSVGDRQSRFRAHFHSIRRARSELRYGHGLLGFGSRHRRFLQNYPARRRRSDDLRRHRSRDHADGHRRIRRHESALHAQ